MARRVAVMFSEQELLAAAREWPWSPQLLELLEDLLDEIQAKREVDHRAHEILEPRTPVRRSQP